MDKKEMAKLTDERPDTDAAAPRPCEAARHTGSNPAIQPGSRFLLQKAEGGGLVRRTHAGGGEEIRAGDFLVMEDQKIFYCRRCREAAIYDARRGGYRLTFYTSAAADRKLAAIREAAARAEKAREREKAAGERRFYPSTKRGERKRK
ncbi:MAG: hypothetical protein HZA37_01945 [Parcubacteria group bacterium]|nr:hypothetical protein [Parcubacteria group bacterium]